MKKLLLSAKRSSTLRLAVTGVLAFSLRSDAQTPPEPQDKYQWLEDVYGNRSLAWVKAENERSAKVLESDPRFAELETAALKVLESPDRLPTPDLKGRDVYNTWQDAAHVRGILRRTSLSDYLTDQPHWHTVLDYDALAKQDNQKWVQKGLACLYPGDELCLVGLSAGGEDAQTLREFNLKTGKFVEGGFVLPKSKQSVAWLDKDTLMVARDWGPGTMTKSGYPFIVKLWRRSQPLGQCKEVYRGDERDMIAAPLSLNDSDGHRVAFVVRQVNFFESEVSLITPQGVTKVALPPKAEINGLLKGQLIVTLNQDWRPSGSDSKLDRKFVQGSIVSLDLNQLKRDPLRLKPDVVFAPTLKEFAQSVDTTKNQLLLTTLENVQGRAYVYTFAANGTWTPKKLNIPDNDTVSIVSANWSDDQFFLSITGFLNPSALLLGDGGASSLEKRQDAAAAIRCIQRHRRAIPGRFKRWNQGALLCGAPQGNQVRRQESHLAYCLRWLPDLQYPALLAHRWQTVA